MIGVAYRRLRRITSIRKRHGRIYGCWSARRKAAGKRLVERLAIYPAYARASQTGSIPACARRCCNAIDADGWPRIDDWSPGTTAPLPPDAQRIESPASASGDLSPILDHAVAGRALTENEIVRLFQARDDEFAAVCASADALRRETCGDIVSYVVTRNINYTNICSFKCQFCAFSKGKMSENLRGRPYNLSLEDVARRAREAWDARRHRSLHAGRHPSGFYRQYLSRHLPRRP